MKEVFPVAANKKTNPMSPNDKIKESNLLSQILDASDGEHFFTKDVKNRSPTEKKRTATFKTEIFESINTVCKLFIDSIDDLKRFLYIPIA